MTMTFRGFQAELERLHQEAERKRRKQKAEAFERIRALILEYQLEPSALGLAEWKWDAQLPDGANGSRSDRRNLEGGRQHPRS